ncbi:MAG TPA: pyrroline-5-carboxylate reductase dimerization domain-containing protein, partial [Saprospiraceae bacterium]|nr:pyrroline-5-carboxylate reductase dimerization domain-containing protein [Saprospiraceae bacterium]
TMIDAATAVSGSGPAYVFYFMQKLIESATEMGFSKAEAEMLSYQTFRGAVELFNKYDFTCQEWIGKVSSKGGTTEAALNVIDQKNAGGHFKEGVVAALQRATELSNND